MVNEVRNVSEHTTDESTPPQLLNLPSPCLTSISKLPTMGVNNLWKVCTGLLRDAILTLARLLLLPEKEEHFLNILSLTKMSGNLLQIDTFVLGLT